MKNYIMEAKRKAGSAERYAVENGEVLGKYIDGRLVLIFHALYDAVYKSVVYYNCATHKFCNHKGQ